MKPAIWPFPYARRLRIRVLAPLIGLVLIAVASLGTLGELAARRQAEQLIDQRGTTAMVGTVIHIDQLRRQNWLLTGLMADLMDLEAAVAAGDRATLARLLQPTTTHLGPGSYLDIYDQRGQRLYMSDAPPRPPIPWPRLVAALASGPSQDTFVDRSVLIVFAARQLQRDATAVGVIVVGTSIQATTLPLLRGPTNVELALFHDAQLAFTSLDQPAAIEALRASSLPPRDSNRPIRPLYQEPGAVRRQQMPPTQPALASLNHRLAPLAWQAVAIPLNDEVQLMVLIPIGDVQQAAQQRSLAGLASIAILVAVLAIVGLALTHDIIRPLESMAAATAAVARGEYDRRVPTSSTVELATLAHAVNDLARTVEQQMSRLRRSATHDALTGLPNRALFAERLEAGLDQATRDAEPLAVLFIDLNDFKPINDTYGHQAGDALLVAVAERLRGCVREGDTVARLGGDEFTLLLRHIADLDEAVRVADRVLERVCQPVSIGEWMVTPSASIGVALRGASHLRADQLLNDADAAMYQAKANGRVRIAVHGATDDHRAATTIADGATTIADGATTGADGATTGADGAGRDQLAHSA